MVEKTYFCQSTNGSPRRDLKYWLAERVPVPVLSVHEPSLVRSCLGVASTTCRWPLACLALE